MTKMLDIFRALADPTRLRIVQLLRSMELSVGELAQVLAQSQPRVSRHIKILCDAGVAERRKEGSWVFIGPGPAHATAPLFQAIDALIDTLGEDHWHIADAARLAAVRADRAAAASVISPPMPIIGIACGLCMCPKLRLKPRCSAFWVSRALASLLTSAPAQAA